jgi:4-hydroxybenzoate polyprenyltransferase
MTAPVLSREFARGYAVTMRPYLLFVSGITGLLGISLAPPTPLATTLALGLVFFFSYGFGQALTDCFQTDTDALSAPYRPLVQGRLRRRDVLVVSLLGLLACGVVLASYQPATLALAVLAVAGLATYTPLKRHWWAGPWYNAWIVGLLVPLGYLAAAGAARAPLGWTPALPPAMAAVFFGYANFVLTGYYKDVTADGATGYRTLPVAFGLGVSAVASDVLAALQLLACAVAARSALVGAPLSPHLAPSLALLAAGVVAAVLGQLRLHGVRDETEAHRAIVPVVHAYVLLGSALAALHQPTWWPALVLGYGAFAAVISRRPLQRQI